MGWLRNNSHWVLFVCFLVSVVLTVGVGLFGAVAALGALTPASAAAAEEFVLLRMLEAALPYLFGLVVMGILDAVFLVGAVVAVLRRASMPRSDRLAKFARKAEEEVDLLGAVGVSDRVEPRPEDRREDLKQRYVEGEMSEAEFERRMRELLDDDEEDPLLNDEFDRNRNYEYE
jgi:uncharacterized membrane protein